MKRILVRAPNWIGDQILAYPFYKELRRHYPNAWIGVICTEWVKDIQFMGLVNEVFVIPKRKPNSLWSAIQTILSFSKTLKAKGPWDLGITLPNSFGSALLLFLSGVRTRRGYGADGRGFLLTERVQIDAGVSCHRAESYLRLLARDGASSFEGQDYWKSGPERKFDAEKYWPEIAAIEPPHHEYFVVAPGATADSRRWTTEQFAEFIKRIQEKYGIQAVLVGGPAEKTIAAKLTELEVHFDDFIARGPASSLWRVFREARFTICNESGLAHMASLCGSKVQIVCGAADPRRTRPIGPGAVQVEVNPVSCWPCERNVCVFQDTRVNRCLKGISPDKVVEEVELGFIRE